MPPVPNEVGNYHDFREPTRRDDDAEFVDHAMVTGAGVSVRTALLYVVYKLLGRRASTTIRGRGLPRVPSPST